MTDLITARPAAFRHPQLPKFKLPGIGIGAAIAAALTAYGKALELALVAPYRGSGSRCEPTVSEDGRDPNW